MPETWLGSLGWEDALEKGKATHSSILACRIPWTVWSIGSQSRTQWSDFYFLSLLLKVEQNPLKYLYMKRQITAREGKSVSRQGHSHSQDSHMLKVIG